MSRTNSIYRFIALTLALLMFTTSVGFAVDMHYCQGQLKSVSFFGKAKNCHEMSSGDSMKNCPHHKKMMKQNSNSSIDKNDCCDNKTMHFQSDQDQVFQTLDFTNKQAQQFILAYVAVFFNSRLIETDTPTFAKYKPPLVLRDIPVLVQSFLL